MKEPTPNTQDWSTYRQDLFDVIDSFGGFPGFGNGAWPYLFSHMTANRIPDLLTDICTKLPDLEELLHSFLTRSDVRCSYNLGASISPSLGNFLLYEQDQLERCNKKAVYEDVVYHANTQLCYIQIVVPTVTDIAYASNAIHRCVREETDSYVGPYSLYKRDDGKPSDIQNAFHVYLRSFGYICRIDIAPAFVFHKELVTFNAEDDASQKPRADELQKLYDTMKELMINHSSGILHDEESLELVSSYRDAAYEYFGWLRAHLGKEDAKAEIDTIRGYIEPWLGELVDEDEDNSLQDDV